ncbi:MAG: HD-GYP domain-containing protein [Anaerolineae bacterium]
MKRRQKQLINESAQLRQRIAELEASETERKWAEEELQHALEKLRKALGGIIHAMALTVETRGPYIAGHQRRAANLARAIATQMGPSEEQIDAIRMAGVVHDLGKVVVPTGILNKPGRLTENEFGIIQTHPQVGYDILKTIEFPWPVAQIVLQHHERMDGSGYPEGLVGKEIVLEARILAVADVVEAMSSHRPYRPALGIDEALEEISRNRGVLYDPNVVDACLKVFTEKGFKFEYGDEESNFTKGHLSGSGSQPLPKSLAPTSDTSETMGVDGQV